MQTNESDVADEHHNLFFEQPSRLMKKGVSIDGVRPACPAVQKQPILICHFPYASLPF